MFVTGMGDRMVWSSRVLGTHIGVCDPVDGSCKQPWCWALLPRAHCSAVTHGLMRCHRWSNTTWHHLGKG